MTRWAVLLILLVTVASYQGVRLNGWVYEDMAMRDVAAGEPGYSVGLLTRNLARWSVYAPARVFGPSPQVQHVVQVAGHLLNGVLVYALALGLGLGSWALLACAIFLLHPMQVETAAYVASRPDLVMTLFLLVAVNLAIRSLTWPRGLLIGAAFFLAMAAKQTGVVLGALLVLIGWWRTPGQREAWVWALGGVVATGLILLALVPVDPDALPYALVLRSAYQSAAAVNLLWLVVWGPVAVLGQLLSGVPLGGPFTIHHDVGMTLTPVALLALVGVLTAVVVSLRALWRGTPASWPWLVLWVGLMVAPRFVLQLPEFFSAHQLYPGMPALCVLMVLTLRRVVQQTVSRPRIATCSAAPSGGA